MAFKKSDSPVIVQPGKISNGFPLANTAFGTGFDGNGSLPGSDFQLVGEEPKKIRIMLYGEPGTGKTTFVTRYAPGPIALINFDGRAGHAVKEARAMGKIVHYRYVPIPGEVSHLDDVQAKRAGQDVLDIVTRNLIAAVNDSLRPGGVRTICLDTITEYSEVASLAKAGRQDLGKPDDYGAAKGMVNRSMLNLFNIIGGGNANLVLLARAKEKWGTKGPTGSWTYRAPSEINAGVDVGAEIRFRKGGAGGVGAGAAKKLEIKITKAGTNRDQLHEIYEEEVWEAAGVGPFVWLATMNIPGSSFEDWQ